MKWLFWLLDRDTRLERAEVEKSTPSGSLAQKDTSGWGQGAAGEEDVSVGSDASWSLLWNATGHSVGISREVSGTKRDCKVEKSWFGPQQ